MLRMRTILGLLGVLAVCAVASGVAHAQADSIVIHTDWMGSPGVLNVHVTGAPPGADIDVAVFRVPDGHVLDPNGNPPNKVDSEGEWPGESAGGEVGYAESADDPGGTKYVVSVIINGQTGPIKGVTKPYSFWKALWEFITFGLFSQTCDGGGALGRQPVPAGAAAHDARTDHVAPPQFREWGRRLLWGAA